MKSVTIVLGLVLLLLAVSVSAQVPQKPFNAYIGGGVSIPTGDLSTAWKLGLHGTGRIGIPAAPKLEFLFGADFHTLPLDKQGLPISGGTFTSLNLGVDLMLNLGVPGAPTKPFLLGGAGFAIIDISDLSGGGLTLFIPSETKFFFEFGAGVKTGRMFIQGKYVNISVDGISLSYIPITVGMTF